jgi:hypothetical protein
MTNEENGAYVLSMHPRGQREHSQNEQNRHS